MTRRSTVLASVLAAAALSACGPRAASTAAAPTAADFTAGMTAYLARRGDLCLAKTAWPIDVTEREVETGARNALQLPVLENLGLAVSATAEVEARDEDGVAHAMKVRRYVLSDAGKKYWIAHDTRGPDGRPVAAHDFCVAHLSLDRVVRVAPAPVLHVPGADDDAAQKMVVTYTYRVAPAPWTADPQARRVFPVVDRVVQGAGQAEMEETFARTADGWVAVDLPG